MEGEGPRGWLEGFEYDTEAICGGGRRDEVRGSRPEVKIAGEDREGEGAGLVGGGRAPSCGRERPAVDRRADNNAT